MTTTHGIVYKVAMNSKEKYGIQALEAYRELSGLSVRELAKRAGLSYQAVYYHLKGQHSIGVDAARKYHKNLGISLDKLLG